MRARVVPYDDAWPRLFEHEAERLRAALAPWLRDGVHHVGSTAVPGLPAKPVLDVLAGVADLDVARAAVPVLAGLGYQHADHRPHEALWFFRQQGGDESRSHHLHLTVPGSALWRERLAFRDALREDPVLRDRYAALKLRLASGAPDVREYTAGKRELVRAVLAEAGIELG